MISRQKKTFAVALYGLAVIASGLLSVAAPESGKAGLWFGFVFGGLALGASTLLWMKWRIVGMGTAWIAVAFVGGWFVYDAFIKSGFGHGDLRKYSVIAISLLIAVVLCLPTKQKSKPRED